MVLEIRTFGDPVLRSKARPVEEFDASLKRLGEQMLQTLRADEGRAALAANQVGVLRRMFVAEMGEEVYVVANSIIEERTPETETDVEGCLSIPGILVDVERHARVVVSGRDMGASP